MLTGEITDTILNLSVFAFIGFVVWLSLRDIP